MKKKILFLMIFVNVLFLRIGVVDASVITDFGTYPDLPGQSDYYMIVKNKNDRSKQFLYFGWTGNNCVYSDFKETLGNSMNIGIEPSSGSGCGYTLYQLNSSNNTWSWVKDVAAYTTNWYASGSYTDYDFANTIPFKLRNNTIYKQPGGFINFFETAFEQGEVLMAQYENSSANLVSFYLKSNIEDFDINNATISYINHTTEESKTINMSYSEEGIFYNGVIYHYYYNLPLFYNTDLTFSVLYDNNSYNWTYNAYLDILKDYTGYRIYEVNNYNFVNMSYINSGKFGLSDILKNIDIFVYDSTTGIYSNFINSNYNTGFVNENGIDWYDFDFNNNSNLYLTINLNQDLWNDSNNYYFIVPDTAYVHLSASPHDKEFQDNSVNQQAYKDSQGNIHYVDNTIVYNGGDDNYYTGSNNYISSVMIYLNGVTSIFTNFILNLETPIQYTIYACVSIIVVIVIINLFKH